MVEERSWDEFRKAGLLWWVNRILHLFGWAIVVELNDDGQNVKRAYPARCKFRGFAEESESRGFRNLTMYMHNEAPFLLGDLDEETDSPE